MENNDFIDINSIIGNSNDSSKENVDNVIEIDRLFQVENEEEKLKEKNKDKKIERIQMGLIIFLVVAGSIVYFFGYDYLAPFIKID